MTSFERKIENYMKECYGPAARVTGIEPMGTGTHGTAYRLEVSTPFDGKRLILKTLAPSGFGHDHFADRARVFLLANDNYNRLPKHVKAHDVVGESPDRLISLGAAREFYIFMEEAEGRPYFRDLDALLERGSLSGSDAARAKALARFLAGLHSIRYRGKNGSTLYRRRIRDLFGHGECIMGIVDTYGECRFTSEEELTEYVRKSLCWWAPIRDRQERLCEVHGDFHPGNIRFHGEDFTLLDRARGTWGEAADDLSCLGVNYIFYAIKQTGTFDGPFAELFRLFHETYLEETGDHAILEVIQPFFAFRVLVVAQPDFYPEETDETRRKLLDFGNAVLEERTFNSQNIARYIEGR